MQATLGDIKRVIREIFEAGPWIVRGGAEVLTRGVGEPASTWRYTVLRAVTYFTDEELVREPSSQIRDQVWVFQRGEALYAISDRQLYSKPV